MVLEMIMAFVPLALWLYFDPKECLSVIWHILLYASPFLVFIASCYLVHSMFEKETAKEILIIGWIIIAFWLVPKMFNGGTVYDYIDGGNHRD